MSGDNGEPNGSGGIDGSDGGYGAPRIRRSTLERFNDELSVLDRPLEADVEYYDEQPPSKRPRMVAITMALFVIGGGGGFLLLSRHIGAPAPPVELVIASPAAAPPAPTVAPSLPPPLPAPPPIAAAPEPEPEPAEITPEAEPALDTVPSEGAIAVAPSAWGRIGHATARAKHARSTKTNRQHRTRR